MQRTIAEINLKAVKDNADAFALATGKKLCAVVKANGYGHGAEEIAAALAGRVEMFAVSIWEEGIALGVAACGKDILVFTPPATLAQAIAIIESGLIVTVADEISAALTVEASRRANRRARVHVKVNGGMNRYGVCGEELKRVCRILREGERAEVEGVYSHLHVSTRSGAEDVRRRFLTSVAEVKEYFPNVKAHFGGTYAALLGEEFCFDMLRVGIGLYGYLPKVELSAAEEAKKPILRKAMTVYAQAVGGGEYQFGGVGYGDFVLCKKGEKLSVLRFGYADGFLRRKENGVLGAENNANNLCMDACIRKSALERGDWLPVMTDADEVADRTGTIAYEVLCAATRRAEFRYVYK